jgi:hypothetical protein
MATPTISTSFIEEFESGVHMAYQRMGSKLRNTIRTANGVKNKTTFQKIGKGFATTKARHGNVAPMVSVMLLLAGSNGHSFLIWMSFLAPTMLARLTFLSITL